jgi:hypothetical protein
MEKRTVDGIKCLVCGDKIWSRKVHDFKWCKCHSVAIEGGQRHIKVTGLENNYELVKINVEFEVGDSMWINL